MLSNVTAAEAQFRFDSATRAQEIAVREAIRNRREAARAALVRRVAAPRPAARPAAWPRPIGRHALVATPQEVCV